MRDTPIDSRVSKSTVLTLPGAVSTVGLALPDSLSFEQWQAVGEQLLIAERSLMWWMGDWWNYGERQYGELAAQAVDSEYSHQAWMNAGWVARKIEISRRREILSWSIHAEVAALPPDDQDSLLEQAEAEGWTVRDTRQAVKNVRRQRLIESKPMAPDNEALPSLICGDAVEEMAKMADETFDLICIDPPYNMDKADWDSFGSGVHFADWAEGWLTQAYRLLRPAGAIYVFGINRMLSHIQHRMDRLGFRYRNWITWDTIQGAGGGLWVNRTESVLYYSKTDKTFEDADAVKLERHEEHVREYKGKEYRFKNPSNIWRFPCVDERHPERTDHPTQKPVEMIERIVQASCPEGGRVLDCFIGSGTTLVACLKNKRRCVGIDANQAYLDIARHRASLIESDQ